jgi:hypothetical protein
MTQATTTAPAGPAIISVHVHPSIFTIFAGIASFFRKNIEPAIAVAEKAAPIVEAVDPALAPEIAAAEAAVTTVENVVDHVA